MTDSLYSCGDQIRMWTQNGKTEAEARARVQTHFNGICVPCGPSAGGAAPSATVSCAVADQAMTDSLYSCGDQIRMMMQYGGKTEADARAQVQTDFNGICVPCT